MEAPRPYSNLSRWKQPYSWLTAAAIGILIFSVIIAIGFVRGYYLNTGQYFLEQYLAGELVDDTFLVFVVSTVMITATVPVMVGLAGAVLLLFKKQRLGVYIILAAVGAYFVMDAVYISLIWDGNHHVYAYTRAMWLIAAYEGHASYSIDTAYAFYSLYIPSLIGITASALWGWKKLKHVA